MNSSRMNLFEIIVLVMIVLVSIWTLFEDVALLSGWSTGMDRLMVLIGFGFDLFFTIEFLVRLYMARLDNGIIRYLAHGYGWIDFLASVPLFMFSSGPIVASMFFSSVAVPGLGAIASIVSLNRLVTIIRIARVFRFLRILKILRNLRRPDTAMGQRHVARIISIGAAAVIVSLLGTTIVGQSLDLDRMFDPSVRMRERAFELIEKSVTSPKRARDLASKLTAIEPVHGVLAIERSGKLLYARKGFSAGVRALAPGEYVTVSNGGLSAHFDARDAHVMDERRQAIFDIVSFVIIVSLMLVYLLFYAPHFALTVTGPIMVMKRGMEDAGYNTDVHIPELFEDDEVYELAKHYNAHYLPLKDFSRQSPSRLSPGLTIDHVRKVSDASLPDDFE